jgi:hypothetical protein
VRSGGRAWRDVLQGRLSFVADGHAQKKSLVQLKRPRDLQRFKSKFAAPLLIDNAAGVASTANPLGGAIRTIS